MPTALVACEFSGRVRDALRAAGIEAYSCDLSPSEGLWPEFHFQCDIRAGVLDRAPSGSPWDLVIAHPPCTRLCASGVQWSKGRDRESLQALEFVKLLWSARGVQHMALENPVGILSSVWMPPTQVIQPWMFGEPVTKATCLWLRGLPPLRPTLVLEERRDDYHRMPQRKSRSRDRSRTLPGVADAMADQWGDYVSGMHAGERAALNTLTLTGVPT